MSARALDIKTFKRGNKLYVQAPAKLHLALAMTVAFIKTADAFGLSFKEAMQLFGYKASRAEAKKISEKIKHLQASQRRRILRKQKEWRR